MIDVMIDVVCDFRLHKILP